MANPNKQDALLVQANDVPMLSGKEAQAALVADGSDAGTTQTLANALKAILVNHGLMSDT